MDEQEHPAVANGLVSEVKYKRIALELQHIGHVSVQNPVQRVVGCPAEQQAPPYPTKRAGCWCGQ